MISTKEIDDYISAVKAVISEQTELLNIRPSNISKICNNNNITLSQGAISSFLNSNNDIKLTTLLKISSALNIDFLDFISMVEDKISSKNESGLELKSPFSKSFLDIFDSVPNGYLGEYNTYFFPTVRKSKRIVHGKLLLNLSADKKSIDSKMIVYLDKKSEGETGNRKEYQGSLVVSDKMNSAYCCLYNKNYQEICFLIFHYSFIINNLLDITMACVATVSSGSNRLPTLHRMCLSRKEIVAEKMDFIKGQLSLNNENILLMQKQLEELVKDEMLPEYYKNILKEKLKKLNCTYIPEASLRDVEMDQREQDKWISYIRANSISDGYNKISRPVEEEISNIYHDNTI